MRAGWWRWAVFGAPVSIMGISTAERMNLMKFVCSFAWTDLSVSQSERDLVMRMCGTFGLNEGETDQVKQWLELPPPIEEVDPTAVPHAHREVFLQMLEMVVKADGKVVPAELESLQLFRDLVAGGA